MRNCRTDFRPSSNGLATSRSRGGPRLARDSAPLVVVSDRAAACALDAGGDPHPSRSEAFRRLLHAGRRGGLHRPTGRLRSKPKWPALPSDPNQIPAGGGEGGEGSNNWAVGPALSADRLSLARVRSARLLQRAGRLVRSTARRSWVRCCRQRLPGRSRHPVWPEPASRLGRHQQYLPAARSLHRRIQSGQRE